MSQASERHCAACGKVLADKNARALYCDRACKQAFSNLSIKRGAEAIAYLQVWRAGKNARSQEAKALASYAFSELCSMADAYNAEDRKAGRNAHAVIEPRMERMERYGDRKPHRKMEPFLPIALGGKGY